ncbi:hypothetical protein RDV16_002926 [Salmonella enterica]|nr:hypothetical protein [Salmonella enterica]
MRLTRRKKEILSYCYGLPGQCTVTVVRERDSTGKNDAIDGECVRL